MVMRAKLTKDDVVLEIGPGTGFLTKKLLEKSKVIAIEIDEIMVDVLNGEFKKEIEEGKLKIIQGDVLEQDFNSLGITKVVSLPPYHISTLLVTKIILSKVKKSLLVLDKGFMDKLTAFEGLSEYGWLSVLTNLNEKVEILEPSIEATSFFPSPNCISSLIEMDLNETDTSSEFHIFIKEIFRHKNKDMSRALKQAAPFLIKELKMKKGFEKKFETLKTRDKKVYLHSPKELAKVFSELTK